MPESAKISVQTISMPKGGGAIRGISGSYQPNLFSGAGSYSIPLPVTAARGLEPQLTLNYNSGSGNSEFGLGFSLSLSQIWVSTNKHIPRYDGSDVFCLTGENQLTRIKTAVNSDGWRVHTFSSRVEGTYSLIEQWINEDATDVYWKVVSKNNITTLYGKTANARITNPENATQISKWLPGETWDAKGNRMVYIYKEENNENVPAHIYELNRNVSANKYLSIIKYGNYFDNAGIEQFSFELVFDYGEHDLAELQKPGSDAYTPSKSWACRPDPYSVYNSGFEIRSYRLCRNVLLFHNFQEETSGYCLVKRLAFTFDHQQQYGEQEITTMSKLTSVVMAGYRKKSDGGYEEQKMPPLELSWSAFAPPVAPEFKKLEVKHNDLPGYFDASGFLPVDLNGDGLPGLLYNNNECSFYFAPEGNGSYSGPVSLGAFPINKNIPGGKASLQDLEGNGELELVVNEKAQTGFYQRNNDGTWGNFNSFSHYPNDVSHAHMETTDLDADGKTDLVLPGINDLQIYFGRGKNGYDRVTTIPNVNGYPLHKQGDDQELVTFADLLGDGLGHRVRIRNGSVECWPCLGYGKFGAKITFGNAPFFKDGPDRKRIFLTDIDGSGAADIVYVYPDRIEMFLNQNGNCFSDAVTIKLPTVYSHIDQLGFTDITGNGTACVVFTQMAPSPVHYYYSFTGEVMDADGTSKQVLKPYLLNKIKNNIGSTIEIGYCSSTKFALEAKRTGRPWVTRLRFPVQVVEQVTTTDDISGARYVNKFRYHDGYYDAVEREFCGFGYVESWDSETYESFEAAVTNPDFPSKRINAALYVYPVYTKTWHHTGAFINRDSITRQYRLAYFNGDRQAYDFPESVIQTEIYEQGNDTLRQACVALKGHVMRTEVYADDEGPLSKNPYTVKETNVRVALVHPVQDKQFAVFRIEPRESISYDYERNPDDPRIQQEFVLEVDALSGETKSSCTVFFPRRASADPQVKLYPEQQLLKATAHKTDLIDTSADLPYRYRGIPYQQQEFEIFNLDIKDQAYFTYEEIKEQVPDALKRIVPYNSDPAPLALQARQLTWNRTFFWNEEQTNYLALGDLSSGALVHHTETASFTAAFVSKAFKDKLSNEILQSEGGYFFEQNPNDAPNSYWWNRGLVQYYSGAAGFYLPVVTANSFVDTSSSLFQKTVIEYDQPFCLLPVSSKTYLNETVYNEETYLIDYQTKQIRQQVDINGNVSQVLFDPLGMVVVSSLFGMENGKETGAMRLYEYNGQPAEYIQRSTDPSGNVITFNNVLSNEEYYLQGAAGYFFYNLYAWPQPAGSINLVRENYFHPAGEVTEFSCQTLIEYTDGLGRAIEKKKKVGAGIALVRDAQGNLVRDTNNKPVQIVTDERWAVSGRAVYNNKGKQCQAYLPYFTNTPVYESQQEIADEDLVPPPTVTHYDPLQRAIRIDMPKGFFSKTAHTPWEEKMFDENDTVLDADYYKENYPAQLTPDEKDAIDKAVVFYNTPVIKVLNNTGALFLDIQTLPEGKELPAYCKTDIQGRVIEATDARLYQGNLNNNTAYYNFKNLYAMGAKEPLHIDSADGGVQLHLSNIFGNQSWSWSSRDYYQVIAYDRLQRRKTVSVKKQEANTPVGPVTDFNLVECYTYGEEQVHEAGFNLRGQVCRLKDLSGIVLNTSYSMQGGILQTSKQLVKDYRTPVNWSGEVVMDDIIYPVEYTYDALRRLLTEKTPDGTVTTNTYNLAGLPDTISVTFNDGNTQRIVNAITYDAKQQRTAVYYGNGIKTGYTYEETTLRLQKLFSTRVQGNETVTVQDITYTYDPVGNITRTRDQTFETVFNGNQKVEPLSDYTYDAIYRLIRSTGRQHEGITANTCKNNKTDNSFKQCIFSPLPPVNDSGKLENYSELYTYDDSGNLISKKHIAASGSFTTSTPVLPDSNRLQGFVYDESGNLRQLDINNPVSLMYNCCENLVKAAVIERPDELDDCDYYVYGAGEQRTRKVSERMAQKGAITQIEEKIYLGNYEVKQIKRIDTSGNETVTLIRQTLRVMDGSSCVAIVHYWVKDDAKRETDETGKRQLRYQMNNNLGSVSLEMDAAGLLISYEEYFPFGGTAIIAGENQKEVAIKDYRYSGKECDDSTGLYYYGARYYAPWLGRWLNADPAGAVDGLNLFCFVGNNPVRFIDKKGHSKEDPSKKSDHSMDIASAATATSAALDLGHHGTEVKHDKLHHHWESLDNKAKDNRLQRANMWRTMTGNVITRNFTGLYNNIIGQSGLVKQGLGLGYEKAITSLKMFGVEKAGNFVFGLAGAFAVLAGYENIKKYFQGPKISDRLFVGGGLSQIGEGLSMMFLPGPLGSLFGSIFGMLANGQKGAGSFLKGKDIDTAYYTSLGGANAIGTALAVDEARNYYYNSERIFKGQVKKNAHYAAMGLLFMALSIKTRELYSQLANKKRTGVE